MTGYGLGFAVLAALIAGWFLREWFGKQPTGLERPLTYYRHLKSGELHQFHRLVVSHENRMDRDYILINLKDGVWESWKSSDFEAEFDRRALTREEAFPAQ